MAYEIALWNKQKEEGCVLNLKVSDISSREGFSREINEKYGEGGGLNANYTMVEAGLVVANLLGAVNGFRYGKEFYFKTTGLDKIIFEFDNPDDKRAGETTIREALKAGGFPMDVTKMK